MSGEGKDTEMTRISRASKERLREIQQQIKAETGWDVSLVDILDRELQRAWTAVQS